MKRFKIYGLGQYPKYDYYSKVVYVTTNRHFLKLKQACIKHGTDLGILSKTSNRITYEVYGTSKFSVNKTLTEFFN